VGDEEDEQKASPEAVYRIGHQDAEGALEARTPVSKLSKMMKRTEGSLRQKALSLGIGLGHQR
jgi:hypothetical protein